MFWFGQFQWWISAPRNHQHFKHSSWCGSRVIAAHIRAGYMAGRKRGCFLAADLFVCAVFVGEFLWKHHQPRIGLWNSFCFFQCSLEAFSSCGPTLFSPAAGTRSCWAAGQWMGQLFAPLFHTSSFTPLCHTPSFTNHLWHTIFDTSSFTPLCHTPSFTHCHRPFLTHHLSHTTLSDTVLDTLSFTLFLHTIFHNTTLSHTISFTTPFLSHTTFSYTIFSPPPPLSFLPSPFPLQHLLLIIGRSWLLGLSGPLCCFFDVLGEFALTCFNSGFHQPASCQAVAYMPRESCIEPTAENVSSLQSVIKPGQSSKINPTDSCFCRHVDSKPNQPIISL